MCTAVAFRTKNFYFGRTLDYEHTFGEEIVFTPRHFPLPLRHAEPLTEHYGILGVARVEQGYPLYFDGFNEKGLAIAGLNFVGNASYGKPCTNKFNIAQFELIPWLLAQCDSVESALTLLPKVQITDTAFSDSVPPAQLHWMLSDGKGTIVLEAVSDGIHIYDNPVGVLTNNPPFPQQLQRLRDFMHLSVNEPKNTFANNLHLTPYSRGMGAIGLPGDLSSQSRFVRAAFTRCNSVCDDSEQGSVNQFFHILGSVNQPRGCCRLGEDSYELTQYTSCCSADKGIYYYTTYQNHQISAVDMHFEDLDGRTLITYPMTAQEKIYLHNAKDNRLK